MRTIAIVAVLAVILPGAAAADGWTATTGDLPDGGRMVEVFGGSADGAVKLAVYARADRMNAENVEVVIDWGAARICFDGHNKVPVTWVVVPGGAPQAWAFAAAADGRRVAIRNLPDHGIFIARTFVRDLARGGTLSIGYRDACANAGTARFDLHGFADAIRQAGWTVAP
jgi:hypothetical protein